MTKGIALEVYTNKRTIVHKNKSAPLSDLFRAAQPLGWIMPDCVRAFTGTSEDLLLFIELPHGVYTIPWSQYGLRFGSSAGRHNYKLALPHILFAAQIQPRNAKQMQVTAFCPFFLNEPLASPDQKLGMPVLPNCYTITYHMRLNGEPIYKALNVCNANQLGSNPQQLIGNALGVFFGQSFNHGGNADYLGFVNHYLALSVLGSPQTWAQATKKDPSFILKLPWPDSGLTVRKLMDMHRAGQLRTNPI